MDIFRHLQGFINGNIKVVHTFLSLVKLEARLAGLSVYPLIITICLLFVILITSWISVMLLLGCLFFFFWENLALAIGLTLVLNLIFFTILVKNLIFNLKNMSFEKTREFFSSNKRRELNESTSPIDEANNNNSTSVARTES